MISKNEVKYYRSLLQKKNRIKEGKFIAEGKKIVEEALNSGLKCEILLLTPQFAESNKSFLNKWKNLRAEITDEPEFKKLADTQNPQGILGVFLKKDLPFNPGDKDYIICLENINDPGNLGSIIRTCDWYNFSLILLSKDCAELYNPKTVRGSMGSIFHLTIYEDIDIYAHISRLRKEGYKLMTADMEGKNLYEFRFNPKSIIAFSNEANGPSEDLLKITDNRITITKLGNAESLNVGSAAAVILNEIRRKKS